MKKNTLRLPEGLIGPVKMVFLDLDGTALNHEKELSANTLQALNLLKLHGIPFTFASARPAAMIGLYCQKANVSGPIIASEGAEIRIWETGNTICQFPIAAKEAVALMEFCHDIGADYTFYTPHDAYFRQDTRRLQRFRQYNDRAVAAGLLPVSCQFYEAYTPNFIASRQVLKVCVIAEDDASRAAVQAFLKQHPTLRSEGSENHTLSIVANTVSKAACVRLLCQMQGIELEDICYFGDYYNDMETLRTVGHSVAMSNAPEAVRDSARYVTASNDEEGVALFIRKHICGE